MSGFLRPRSGREGWLARAGVGVLFVLVALPARGQVPVVTLEAPPEVLVGEDFHLRVSSGGSGASPVIVHYRAL